MARVDTVIQYPITEGAALAGAELGPVFVANRSTTEMRVAAAVKKTAATVLRGSSGANWADASICTAATFGYPADPDTFEVSMEVDGDQTFGWNHDDSWTYMPGKDGLPGLFVRTSEDVVAQDVETDFITKSAETWSGMGVDPAKALALSGLGLRLRLSDEQTGLASVPGIRAIREEAGADEVSTAGIMLQFASTTASDMWLGEKESFDALRGMAEIMSRFDPEIQPTIERATASLALAYS